MQRYTVYYISKLLYMFRVVPTPVIRSAYNCFYSICYLSQRYCCLPLTAGSFNSSSNSSSGSNSSSSPRTLVLKFGRHHHRCKTW